MQTRLACLGVLSLAAFVLLEASPARQAPPASAVGEPVVASYYKLAPGKTEEWLELYRSQHLPILRELRREGRILDIVIYRPLLHQGDPSWDFKVVLVFRDFANWGDRAHQEAIERRLYPDWDAHQAQERRRWEVTEKHWDDLMLALPAD